MSQMKFRNRLENGFIPDSKSLDNRHRESAQVILIFVTVQLDGVQVAMGGYFPDDLRFFIYEYSDSGNKWRKLFNNTFCALVPLAMMCRTVSRPVE